jgi:superfamily I DNA/RNA helicase
MDTEEAATRKDIQWDQSDPFAIDEPAGKRLRETPAPGNPFSQKETNAIHRELLEEIEEKAAQIHPNLRFYEQDNLDARDMAQYDREEAEEILRTRSRLNQEQIAAALQLDGDLNIQALAGTGKTSLLSAGIAWLLALGTDQRRIMICSHTVSAAMEIAGRILPTIATLFPKTKEAIGEETPPTGTIHAHGLREMIVHNHPKGRWSVLDEPAQLRLWKEAELFSFPERVGHQKDSQTNEEMRLADRIRGYDMAENSIPETLKMLGDEESLEKIAQTYQKIKEARKLIDYTDILREWATIIVHPGYTNKWDYIFVDEFQDTNPLQKFLLKLLKLQGAKLVVCGDARQSINSFTGSDPTSHLAFFETCQIPEAWLVTNYRCSKEIVALANAVIGSMNPPETGRLKAHANAPEGEPTKMVWTNRGKTPKGWQNPKEAEEEKRRQAAISCREAATMYERLKANQTTSVALLYRTNAQGGSLEEAMAALNGQRKTQGLKPLPYVRKDYRRTAFRTRTEREILAVLKAIGRPDTANWGELLLSPYFPGIGEVTSRTISRKAEKAKPHTREEAMQVFDGELTRRGIEVVGGFFDAWEACENPSGEPDPQTTIQAIESWITTQAQKKKQGENSKKELETEQRRGYEAAIFERVIQKAQNGLPLWEAAGAVEEENEKAALKQNNANRAAGLGQGSCEAEKEEGIILSTIHLAKGREYDGVVIHQVSKGSLPHFNALRFYENPRNAREKALRKYTTFPCLQKEGSHPNKNTLPGIWRTGVPTTPAENPVEEWEDINNPIEEEKRLLYVAITRAKELLTITSQDDNYQFLPKEVWEKLRNKGKFNNDG